MAPPPKKTRPTQAKAVPASKGPGPSGATGDQPAQGEGRVAELNGDDKELYKILTSFTKVKWSVWPAH